MRKDYADAKTELQARLAKESDPLVKQDLEILNWRSRPLHQVLGSRRTPCPALREPGADGVFGFESAPG